ncbi:transcriptional repressor [Synechococcus phage MinM1]|nr:transcriptional repressor [Synechococcus phage MinM1]
MPDRPERDLNRYIVRFPEGMRDRIAEAAKANGRSMNAEIVHRLEQSFARGDLGDAVAMELDLLHSVTDRLTRVLQVLDPARFKEVAPGVVQFSIGPSEPQGETVAVPPSPAHGGLRYRGVNSPGAAPKRRRKS